MSEKILVPVLGESVTEATVSKWLKNEGDKVTPDEPLVELETDKVNVEVPSPSSGTLENISVKEGQTVNVGTLLGTIGASKSKDSDAEVKNYTPPVKKSVVEKKLDVAEEVEPLVLKSKTKKLIKKEEQPLILGEPLEDKKETQGGCSFEVK